MHPIEAIIRDCRISRRNRTPVRVSGEQEVQRRIRSPRAWPTAQQVPPMRYSIRARNSESASEVSPGHSLTLAPSRGVGADPSLDVLNVLPDLLMLSIVICCVTFNTSICLILCIAIGNEQSHKKANANANGAQRKSVEPTIMTYRFATIVVFPIFHFARRPIVQSNRKKLIKNVSARRTPRYTARRLPEKFSFCRETEITRKLVGPRTNIADDFDFPCLKYSLLQSVVPTPLIGPIPQTHFFRQLFRHAQTIVCHLSP